MRDIQEYDALMMFTPAHFEKATHYMHWQLEYLPVRNLIICGNSRVGEYLEEYRKGETISSEGKERLRFLNEEEILGIEQVRQWMQQMRRKVGMVDPNDRTVGWYYQQFLKLSYARICPDAAYMTWDGDTVPCREFQMFSRTLMGKSRAYFDCKDDHYPHFMETVKGIFPDLKLDIPQSFVSEHMLFQKGLVLEMMDQIEKKSEVEGDTYWKKILSIVGPRRLANFVFSEFETYGNYCMSCHPGEYLLREWYSFRHGGEVFSPEELTSEDLVYFGRDFYGMTFESYHEFDQEMHDLFCNPRYRQNLSAMQIMQEIRDYLREKDSKKDIVW